MIYVTKIKGLRSKSDNDESLLLDDEEDDLEPVNVIEPVNDSLLFSMLQNMHATHETDDDFDMNYRRDNEIQCIHCHRFYSQGDVCPFCHMTQQDDDCELIEPFQDSTALNVARQGVRLSHTYFQKNSWEDTRKEQLSLELGSPEYEAYEEGLMEQDPFRPTDDDYQALLEHNADLVTQVYDTVDNPFVDDDELIGKETAAKILAREQQQKRAIHSKAVREAVRAAAQTDTLSDDALARAITTDNPMLYDAGIKVDDYIEAVQDYIEESTL